MKKFLMIISMLLVLSFAFFLVCDILTDFTSQKDAKGGNQESSVKDQDSMDNSFSSGNENISGSEKQILRLSEGELDWIMIPVRGSDGNIGYGLVQLSLWQLDLFCFCCADEVACDLENNT